MAYRRNAPPIQNLSETISNYSLFISLYSIFLSMALVTLLGFGFAYSAAGTLVAGAAFLAAPDLADTVPQALTPAIESLAAYAYGLRVADATLNPPA